MGFINTFIPSPPLKLSIASTAFLERKDLADQAVCIDLAESTSLMAASGRTLTSWPPSQARAFCSVMIGFASLGIRLF